MTPDYLPGYGAIGRGNEVIVGMSGSSNGSVNVQQYVGLGFRRKTSFLSRYSTRFTHLSHLAGEWCRPGRDGHVMRRLVRVKLRI
jgi:hypothetical protein